MQEAPLVFNWLDKEYNIQARAKIFAAFILLPNNQMLKICGWINNKPILEKFDGILYDHTAVALARRN